MGVTGQELVGTVQVEVMMDVEGVQVMDREAVVAVMVLNCRYLAYIHIA